MNLVHNSIYLKKPTYKELKYTKELWEDEETMAFNKRFGGIVLFPVSKWQAFHDTYLTENPNYIYFHIYNLDSVMVGEVSARYDEDEHGYLLNIKVFAKYRGNHHGYDALYVFIEYLFDDIGATQILDNIASENVGARQLLERIGFDQDRMDNDVIWYRLRNSDWE
jgi:RimJ/RimL family protein N-acetyltransferase